MGLYVHVGARVKTGWPFGRSRAKRILDRVKSAIENQLQGPLLEDLVTIWQQDGILYVDLHPAASAIEFSLQDDGFLVCSAKTSSAGPGYHAALVELLDGLEQACSLTWEWDNVPMEFGDHTGFQSNRDFPALQIEMLRFLRRVAQFVLQREDGVKHHFLSVPVRCISIAGDYFAISPMGYWDREWFEAVAGAEPEDLTPQGAEYFPWWNHGRDAAFWRGCGLVKAWLDLPWHPPCTKEEGFAYLRTLSCFRRARSLDPAIALPDQEIAEIRRLISLDHFECIVPPPGRIGFRRGPLLRRFPPGWEIEVPGYYYEDLEDEGRTEVYWYGGRTIRISAITVSGKDDNDVPPESLLPEKPTPLPPGVELFEFAEPGFCGQAQVKWTQDGEEAYWVLLGQAAVKNNVFFITIRFDDPADREWALDTWRSVRKPRDDERQETSESVS